MGSVFLFSQLYCNLVWARHLRVNTYICILYFLNIFHFKLTFSWLFLLIITSWYPVVKLYRRVSRKWWLLRLTIKILAMLWFLKLNKRSYIHFNWNHSLRSSDIEILINFDVLSQTVLLFFQGTCVDLVNNYTCNCFAGFTGSNCDIKIENCADDSCYPNVTCFKNSEIISCGPCPLGFTGDGKNCKGINSITTRSLLFIVE